MIKRIRQVWIELWFGPGTRAMFVATRAIVALYALWLVLSRPMLWVVTTWEAPLFPYRHPTLLLRFGLSIVPSGIEHSLYRLIPLLLVAVLFGIAVRVTAILASLLLYHFAPLEEFFAGLFSNGHSGFAFAVLALMVLAFADRPREPGPSSDYRWPVVMIQSLLAIQYLFGGLSKIRYTGLDWYNGPNIAATAQQMATLTGAAWGHVVGDNLVLAWGIALGTLALELLFPLAVVSPRARWVLIPVALVAHLIRTRVYGLYFLGWPLLLLFVNWDFLRERLMVRRASLARPAVARP